MNTVTLMLSVAITAPMTTVPLAAQAAAAAAARQAMFVAEDRRAADDASLAPLVRGLASKDPATAIQAVRGLGRMERAALIVRVAPLLADARTAVRVEAAHALGQLGQDTAGTAAAAEALVAALAGSPDAALVGAVVRSLTRLPGPLSPAAVTAIKALLGRTDPALMLDLARSMEAVSRGPSAALFQDQSTRSQLAAWAALQTTAPPGLAASIRRAAVQAFSRLDRGNEAQLARALGDRDPLVRHQAAVWLADTTGLPNRRQHLTTALADPDWMVRLAALRAWSRHFQSEDCGPLIRALKDPAPHVGLTAIDLLGRPCPAAANAVDALYVLVDSLAGSQRGSVSSLARWHRGARAMVSVARIAPNRVRGVFNRAATNEAWQVRMYTARAAGIVGDADRVRDFLADRDDNVRQAAIEGMLKARGHGADSVFMAQLRRPDYQLVMTAAQALKGTPNKAAVATALIAALDRITAEKKETSRDPRMAILERLGEVGTPSHAPSLERFLTDFDPDVATRAAELLTQWTGTARQARPSRLAPVAVNWAEAQRLKGSRLRFTMAPASGGGVFEIALYPDVAPATVLRIVQRVREKHFDGLTFHRVEPTFVIQGGSPGANEYAGDALYMRDEVSALSHERGTLGISTRGRDTGDAQIFVNLIDNPRLDFGYTVWGRVTRGMDVIDGMLEGDVFESVVVR